jgi:hypothetical protein
MKQSPESSETVQKIEPPTELVKPVNLSLELNTTKANEVNNLDKGILGRFRKVLFRSHQNSEEAIPVVVNCEEDSSASASAAFPVVKDKLTGNNIKDEPKEKHAVSDSSLFRRIGRWFGFGREKGGSDLFADHKFWSEMESFLTSLEGSDLFAKSRTRYELRRYTFIDQ